MYRQTYSVICTENSMWRWSARCRRPRAVVCTVPIGICTRESMSHTCISRVVGTVQVMVRGFCETYSYTVCSVSVVLPLSKYSSDTVPVHGECGAYYRYGYDVAPSASFVVCSRRRRSPRCRRRRFPWCLVGCVSVALYRREYEPYMPQYRCVCQCTSVHLYICTTGNRGHTGVSSCHTVLSTRDRECYCTRGCTGGPLYQPCLIPHHLWLGSI